MALLRCLIKHHRLRRIFAERLTAKDLPNYRERIAVLLLRSFPPARRREMVGRRRRDGDVSRECRDRLANDSAFGECFAQPGGPGIRHLQPLQLCKLDELEARYTISEFATYVKRRIRWPGNESRR
jgi:hypothetical protein